jgi:hypothetical protein
MGHHAMDFRDAFGQYGQCKTKTSLLTAEIASECRLPFIGYDAACICERAGWRQHSFDRLTRGL